MKYRMLGQCPVCGQQLTVTRLSCEHCQTVIEGEFIPCKFCRLPAKQLEFIETFIKCRGSIKDVEKELNISYPTVRNRLDGVIRSLGYQVEHADEQSNQQENDGERKLILSMLENGEIAPEEATKRLKELKQKTR